MPKTGSGPPISDLMRKLMKGQSMGACVQTRMHGTSPHGSLPDSCAAMTLFIKMQLTVLSQSVYPLGKKRDLADLTKQLCTST